MSGVPAKGGGFEGENLSPIDHAPSHILTLRVELQNRPGTFARLATEIAHLGGNLGAVEIISVDGRRIVRDLEVFAGNEEHGNRIVDAVRKLEDIHLINVSDQIFHMHLGGKIRVQSKFAITDRTILSQVYTPGVARVARAIAKDPQKVQTLTIKRNTVAIVTDGTAVLGMGNFGAYAAIPVMEGKAMLFKEFADIDAFPICLDTTDPEKIIETCRIIAPVFGGINLEDIAAPRCFEVEERLRRELDIPVFHDDQHGTAIVVLAAALNALKIVRKKMYAAKILIAGAGAAGTAVVRMLRSAGARDILCCDRRGVLGPHRLPDLDFHKSWLARHTNPSKIRGSLEDAARGADLFIGLSGPGTFPLRALKRMAKDPIVFALANPVPEILPEEAEPYARVIATGRSDYPNQINNVLAFPGVFRGALDVHAREITDAMNFAAARAIAGCVSAEELSEECIVPSLFNKQVALRVAQAVGAAARDGGVARKIRS
ncbi:MAG: NAD-dependent malic enzyme [Verrucomicrobiae bacterium]|nr:NAD-dependent malic enzyme [Verrucomicrobiae bacterium]